MIGIRRSARNETRIATLEAALEQHHTDIQRLWKRLNARPQEDQGVLPGWSAICVGPCYDPPTPTPTPTP